MKKVFVREGISAEGEVTMPKFTGTIDKRGPIQNESVSPSFIEKEHSKSVLSDE